MSFIHLESFSLQDPLPGRVHRKSSVSHVLVDTASDMQTSTSGIESVEPPPRTDQVEMDLDQDQKKNGAQMSSSESTQTHPSIHEAAPGPQTKKLSLEERLKRLSKYRIRPTSIRSTAKAKGKGGKADVIRANFKRNKGTRGKRVAVKKLRCDDLADEKFSKEFVNEVELLAGLSHKNIVQFIGFVEDLKHRKAWIVLSWEPNGNVREFLASGKWEIPERISLIRDMFEGLQYLHTRQPPICHGDLKSLNILVSSSYHAIITDFGSARVLRNELGRETDQDTAQHAGQSSTPTEGGDCPKVTVDTSANELTLTGPAWSLRWAAPEVFREEKPSLASDIWSAGWVCWEMMTDKVPFEDLNLGSAIISKVVQGKLPVIREDEQLAQVIALCSLMTDCWKYKPEDRPLVGKCLSEVEWMPSVPPSGETSSGDKELDLALLLSMSYMHYSEHRYEKAAALLEKAVRIAESNGDDETVADALERLGDIHYIQCRCNDAEGLYARAQKIYRRLGNDKGRASTLEGLGAVYGAQRKYAEAEESYTRAQEIYARMGDEHGQANTLDGLGAVYNAQRKYAKAEESYSRAKEVFDQLGGGRGRANTLEGLAGVYNAQGRFNEAEQLYIQAQESYARIGDDQGRANALKGLGQMRCAQSKYAEAEELTTQAEEIYARIGDDRGRADALKDLGQLRYVQSRYTETEELLAQAQEIFASIDDHNSRANTMRELAALHCVQSKFAEAEQAYTQAQNIYASIGNEKGRANTLDGLGEVYRAQCNYAEAEPLLRRAQEIYTRIGDDVGLANTIMGLGTIYTALCKYTEAEESYSRAQEIYLLMDDEAGRLNALNELGDVYLAQKQYGKAQASYLLASDMYADIGDYLGRANTLCRLGKLFQERDCGLEAAIFYTKALDLYSEIGESDEADDASDQLAAVLDKEGAEDISDLMQIETPQSFQVDQDFNWSALDGLEWPQSVSPEATTPLTAAYQLSDQPQLPTDRQHI